MVTGELVRINISFESSNLAWEYWCACALVLYVYLHIYSDIITGGGVGCPDNHRTHPGAASPQAAPVGVGRIPGWAQPAPRPTRSLHGHLTKPDRVPAVFCGLGRLPAAQREGGGARGREREAHAQCTS